MAKPGRPPKVKHLAEIEIIYNAILDQFKHNCPINFHLVKNRRMKNMEIAIKTLLQEYKNEL